MNGHHAFISPKARIGRNVTIGEFTIIHDNVIIGDGVTIESHCIIGRPTPLAEGTPLTIGEKSLIRSHSVLYEGSTLGAGLRTGHHVLIREKTVAGLELQLGSFSNLEGQLTIGNHTRTHSNVHLGMGSTIGNFCWFFPYVVLTNDPHPPSDLCIGVTVEDYAAIATMSCVLPGIRVGTRSLVGASSVVNRDVPPETIVVGNPAKVIGPTSNIKHRDGSGESAYPWTKHFHKNYPKDAVAEWMAAHPKVVTKAG